MRRIIKVLLAIFSILIIIIVAFGAVFFLDVVAYTATGSQTLTSQGTSVGAALVLYDPGLSGAASRVAEKIATDLQAKGYTATLAGIKSSAASNTAGYSVIVAGSPIYAGSPTSSVKDFLGSLNPSSGTKVGVFGSGQGATTPDDVAMIRNAVPALQSSGALSGAVVVKIGESEDLTARATDFVNQLVS
ncbi:MAG TPA: flavodoxin domain-containing protein [Candidatus Acidoferrales bacterium]|nr:flavodoxin domain-containing protein [Candidatus Acidoferrales bacterium]